MDFCTNPTIFHILIQYRNGEEHDKFLKVNEKLIICVITTLKTSKVIYICDNFLQTSNVIIYCSETNLCGTLPVLLLIVFLFKDSSVITKDT